MIISLGDSIVKLIWITLYLIHQSGGSLDIFGYFLAHPPPSVPWKSIFEYQSMLCLS